MKNLKPSFKELEDRILDLQKEIEFLKIKEKCSDNKNTLYRLLYENCFDAFLLTSPDGEIFCANPAACNLFGYSEQQICEGGRDLLVNHDDTRLLPAIRIRNRKGYHSCELSFRKKDGTIFEGACTSMVFTDSEGNTRTSMIIRDVSNQKNYQKFLEDNEKKVQVIFDVLPIGISLIGKDRKIIEANSTLEKIIRLSKSDIIEGKFKARKYLYSDGTIMPVEELASSKAILENRVIQNQETGILLEDNSIIWTSVSAAPLHIDNFGAIVVTIDITQEKKLIDDLKEAKLHSEETEKQFHYLFENMEQGFALHEMLYDESGNPVDYRFIMINKAFRKLTRSFENENIIGKTVREVLPHTEQVWIENYGRVARTGIPFSFESYSVEFNRFYNVVAYSPKKDFFAVVFTDITENKNYEKEITAAKEKAEESDRLKSAFLQNISHEIRTPLNAIYGFSGLLSDPCISWEKRKEFINIIQDSCNQLIAIVSDILTISSIETRQERVVNSKFPLNKILIELYTDFVQRANDKKISLYIKMELPDTQSEITTDKLKIIQIFSCLMSNAIKFTHEGYVEFGYEVKNDFIQFFVKDTGIGIKAEFQDKVFESFRKTNFSNEILYGGTGLGLTISKAFVELLGGKIWFQSEEGKGTSFYFTIPYKPAKEKVNPYPEVSITNGKKIFLIAEDEVYNFQLIQELLGDIDISMIHARNGKEAIEIFTSNKEIGLILMDIKMPIMDGYEAAKIIKSIKPDLPIIAQTAYALKHERAKFENVFDDYITKPLNTFELIQKIKKYFPF